jgi:hypothetical protein
VAAIAAVPISRVAGEALTSMAVMTAAMRVLFNEVL